MCRYSYAWGCMISRASSSSSKPQFLLLAAFLLLLGAQCFVWFTLKPHRPNMAIVPPLPTKNAVKALSLGDSQLYFRILAFRLQNAGDTFGRNTPLKDYDYALLERWFLLLDGLDAKSNFVPALAGYYFAQSQNVEDVRYVVRYLEQHYDRDPQTKWWWLSQAMYLANHRLKDKPLALRLATKLSQTPAEVPIWARQMPAFIYEQMGEREAAYRFIRQILDHADDLSPHDIQFMEYFIRDRLKFLEGDEDHGQ